ncbi:MAG: TetR/AcrR family transcriptional regulator [Alphaproteobacteria bacterium]|nr:TetR/AcrR family transcriptional regulator [Alphaproteobacteria bacterium]MBU0796021.1 TetR/AcrR family transcriptional regulator [Alphaproteobacteria bacterium]MBU0886844.1 TetR/AcrR family transcriptional regulator [Alphaproteobacteria bacterium]MBU1812414.1 TetR/AcrR family transcriptional regulator [Alphaproteobacteria bacterium]MBU2089382.1 TetR/AcrR family transcriptional regulator [Alphaproteobacteria bacterium]
MRGKSTTPRKLPTQTRSRQTVATILEAAAQVLMRNGYDRTTTNLVAEKAGVSIGSLYEYFPNKEALVAALASAHIDELIARIDNALQISEEETPSSFVGALIRAGLDAHRVNPALHKVLVEQVPRIGGLAESLDIQTVLQQKIEHGLHERSPHLPPTRARMIALVLETCIEALTHRAIVEKPDWLETGEIEAEAQLLLEPYFQGAL